MTPRPPTPARVRWRTRSRAPGCSLSRAPATPRRRSTAPAPTPRSSAIWSSSSCPRRTRPARRTRTRSAVLRDLRVALVGQRALRAHVDGARVAVRECDQVVSGLAVGEREAELDDHPAAAVVGRVALLERPRAGHGVIADLARDVVPVDEVLAEGAVAVEPDPPVLGGPPAGAERRPLE